MSEAPAPRRVMAWVVFGVLTLAYLVGILQRSSMGFAAVAATERFAVAATVLSMLGVVQIVMYAAFQIPVGVLIDRWGPRPLLLAGTVFMVLGQTTVALSEHIGFAILGRALVGVGDAATFTAAVRAVAMWFDGRRLPFLSQVFAQVGQVGQLVSAFPFVLLLHASSWTIAFLSAASCSVVAAVALVIVFLTSGAAPMPHVRQPLTLRETLRHLGEALRRPGTQVGFWSHFVSQSPLTTFTLLWGVPFLTSGIGLPTATASALVAVTVVVGMVCGPMVGILSARFPFRRTDVILALVVAMGVVWAAVLAWPGAPPLWLLVVMLVVMAIGGPASMIGFDFARSYNPARQHGSATGIVNVGGFLAAFTMMLLIGVVLDIAGGRGSGASTYSLASFRWAFLVQYPVVGFGAIMLLRTRRRMRRSLRADEGITVAPIWIAVARRLRRAV